MAYGEHSANENLLVTMPEAIVGVVDTTQTPVLAIDISTDGKGYDDLQRFTEHDPDGIMALVGAALVGEEGQVAGNFMPHYGLMPQRLNAICGNPVSTTTLTDGRIMRKWKMPEVGRRNINTFSAYYGFGNSALELRYGKITQVNIDCNRSGDVSGNITMHYNYVRRAATVPGSVAQNEVQTIVSAVPVVLNAQNGGTAQTLTPGTDNLAAIQTKIAAAVNKTNGDIVVTGTSTAAVTGNGIANPTVAPGQNANAAAWTGASGVYQFGYTYTNSTGETILSPLYTATLTNGTAAPNLTSPALPTNATGVKWYMSDGAGSSILRYASVTTQGIVPSAVPASTAAIAPTSNTSSTTGTPAALNLTITYSGASVANTAQSLISSSTVSATITRTAAGGNGGGAILTAGDFLEPTHAVCYKATDYADLQTIDMGNATTPAPLTDPHLIRTAQAHTFSMDGLADPVYFEDRSVNPASHVDGATMIQASITLPKDEAGRCEELYATDNNGARSVTAFYLRQAYRCGINELWIDLFCGRNAKPTFPVENNIAQRQFPLRRFYNPNGSVIFTTISAP